MLEFMREMEELKGEEAVEEALVLRSFQGDSSKRRRDT